jgi:hypothetical protein
MVVRWQFYDPVATETYTFEINPNAGGSPTYKKSVNYQNTTAPDGKTLIYEGQDEVQELEWSGVILTQTHYDKYIEWWQKRRQIRLTDDLGRQYWIYLTSFVPNRVRASSRPWKHEFTATAVILDWI